ncbi:MAG: TIGR03617 family F420-dependent LLM class oxidoreductase [Deltaproteobacteria bacterium]|nr:TIGR03617 family F420-dependent LLM class oxidoreductase [Deltaproteobacteria bacterium]MBW2393187.1 TIGR03617 family F420-dependent LLM class oxidoreductase [Deltaproteobacteria bacterium]
MRVYASVDDIHLPLADYPAHAQRAERLGFDGLIVPEAVNDAILGSLLALEHTERIQVFTGVVVAFARSPMLLAQDAWGLAKMSGGRFGLGLGPQVKGNIEKRFGMPWSAPAARMRDYVGALRAIFDCWQNATPLRYESESYTLTRMQPFFSPGPIEHPVVPIMMGAIGPKMARVAGEVADKVIAHPTNSSPGYLRDVTGKMLEEGAKAAGRDVAEIEVIANPMTATGPDAEAVSNERKAAREILAFTYSTPAYWATLEHHGWGEVGRTLHEKTREGDWAGMAGLINDEMLDVLVPSAPYAEIAGELAIRYGGIASAISLRMPRDPADDGRYAEVVAALRAS